MTTTLELGFEPGDLRLHFTLGADFVDGFDLTEALDVDATLALRFSDDDATTWPATIDGTAVDWNVQWEDVLALAETLTFSSTVDLVYKSGTVDLIWKLGGIIYHGTWSS